MNNKNNNDISLFEKIAFVNNIPTETDAYKLSKDYPFAVIITQETEQGLLNGISKTYVNNVPDVDVNANNFGSGNIWIGGKRLTKFINVDKERHSIPMDTYSIELGFDSVTGLLSLYTQAKLDDYELVTLFYKNSGSIDNHGELKIYVDKSKLSGELNSVISTDDSEYVEMLTNTIINENSSYLNFSNQQYIWNIDTIDSIDNTFYIIVRYEAGNVSSLNSVSESSYNLSIPSNNANYNILVNATRFNDRSAADLRNYGYTETDIVQIKNITTDIRYKDYSEGGRKPGEYIIYKLKVTDNVNNNGNSSNIASDIKFKFESISDFSHGLNIMRNSTFINPDVYQDFNVDLDDAIKLYCGDDLINDKNIFIRPGETKSFSLEFTPENLRDELYLYVCGDTNDEQPFDDNMLSGTNLLSNLGISDDFYIRGTVDQETVGHAEYNSQYIISQDNNYSNKFNFSITASNEFTYKNISNDGTKLDPENSSLRFILAKKVNNELIKIYDSKTWNNSYTLYKSTFEGLKIDEAKWSDDINDGTSAITSGKLFSNLTTGDVFALYSKRMSMLDQIPEEEYEKVLINQDNDLHVNISFIDITQEGVNNHEPVYNNVSNTSDLSNLNNQLPSRIVPKQKYNIIVPCIYKTYKYNSNSEYNNKLEWSFSYHNNIDNLSDTKDVNAIKSLNINADSIDHITLHNGLKFYYNVNNLDSELTTSVVSGTNIKITPIKQDTQNLKTAKIYYTNHQSLDLFKYGFNNLSTPESYSQLKNSIEIGTYDEATNNFIINQNIDGLTNKKGLPYLVANNDNIVYQSDININTNTTIYLDIKFTDPNYSREYRSTDKYSLNFNKYEVVWYFYIQMNVDPNNPAWTIERNVESDDYTLTSYPQIPEFGPVGSGKLKYGFRKAGQQGTFAYFWGGWSYLGKLDANNYLEFGADYYNNYLHTSTPSSNLINPYNEILLIYDEADEDHYVDSGRATNFIIILPDILDITDSNNVSVINDGGAIKIGELEIDNGPYSVYMFTDTSFSYNIQIK